MRRRKGKNETRFLYYGFAKMLNFINRLRPFLKKVIPVQLLRKFKKLLVGNALKNYNKIGRKPFKIDKKKIGINVIGDFQARNGLGQSARIVLNQLKRSSIDYKEYPFSLVNKTKIKNLANNEKNLLYSINLFHIQPYEIGEVFLFCGKTIWDEHYNIGFCIWELEEIPDDWLEYLTLFDEIWTPSIFSANAFKKKINLPVCVIPYSIEMEVDENYDRRYFGLPLERFLFLVMYDSHSTIERKNPQGAISAFQKTFSPEDNRVGLIIKINNATSKEISKLRNMTADYKNIYFLTEPYNKMEVNSLINCIDAIVSLHRAEGFGLVLAEAMALGKAVIATNWSANTEFMDEETACLVGFKKVSIQSTSGHYKKGMNWAEPNIEQAEDFMYKLVNDNSFYSKIANNARMAIEKNLDNLQISKKIEDRIRRIYFERL